MAIQLARWIASTFAKATADTLAWFNSLPEERRTKLRAGLAPEKEAAALKAWKQRGA